MESNLRVLDIYSVKTDQPKSSPSSPHHTQNKSKLNFIYNQTEKHNSVASLLDFSQEEYQQEWKSEFISRRTPSPTKSIVKEKAKSHEKHELFPPLSSRLLNPETSEIVNSMKEKRRIKNELILKEREAKYDRYIDQYLQKMGINLMSEKCPKEVHCKIIQEACQEIREKMEENYYSKGFTDDETDVLRKKRFEKDSFNSKNKSIIKLDQIDVEKREILNLYKSENTIPISNDLSLSKNRQNKLFERGNLRKNAKSLLNNKIYWLNADHVGKVNNSKKKENKKEKKSLQMSLNKKSYDHISLLLEA